jgi:hypothetical protein
VINIEEARRCASQGAVITVSPSWLAQAVREIEAGRKARLKYVRMQKERRDARRPRSR